MSANIGRFGPYVRYGSSSFRSRGDDPYTITLERALQLIAEKKIADANRLIRDFPDAGIQVLNGRYGPYVTNKEEKREDPEGSRAERAHARGMPGVAGGGARAARTRHAPRQSRRTRGRGREVRRTTAARGREDAKKKQEGRAK